MGQLTLQNPYLCRYYYGHAKFDSVVQLQERLNEVEPTSMLNLDGFFGEQTQETVKRYQQRMRIRVDGIVGPETLACLNRPKQNHEFIPENEFNGGMLSGFGDNLGIPINYIGTDMSSVDTGYKGGLIQEEVIESTPLFKLEISYDDFATENSTIKVLDLPEQSSFRLLNDRAFGFVSQIIKPILIAEMTRGFHEYIDSFGLRCSFNYNNYYDIYSIRGKELNNKSRQVINTIRKASYTLNIDVDYWLGAQIGKRVLPILQKARPIFNTLVRINISTERISHLLHTANDIIADIVNLLRNQVQNLMHFVSNQRWLSGLVNRVGVFLKRFIPVAKVVSSVAMFAQLLLHIRQGNKEKVLEDLLTIVKDFVVGVATTAAVSALMAVGIGEIAIAIVILFAILDYLFFNPDPDNSILPTHNLIAERVQ